MENFRSKSCRDGSRMQMESYYGGRPGPGASTSPSSMHELRSFSTSHHTSLSCVPEKIQMGKEVMKMKKGKSTSGGGGGSDSVSVVGSTSTSSKSWSLNNMIDDAELQRKKRVAGYKVYGVEGKMKGSFRKSFRWIKVTYTHVFYGWW